LREEETAKERRLAATADRTGREEEARRGSDFGRERRRFVDRNMLMKKAKVGVTEIGEREGQARFREGSEESQEHPSRALIHRT
jgi:hypothetical protein